MDLNGTVDRLIAGQAENHLMPFFWQHGEDEKILRKYVGVIQDANCNAFCVESRPHPDFAGEGWWRDMDIILDEAERRGMKVWILDDSHFPTGYANGAMKTADPSLCRQSIFCHIQTYEGGARTVRLDHRKLLKPPKFPMNKMQRFIMASTRKQRKFTDDRIFSMTAYGPAGEVEDLGVVTQWEKPAGTWKLAVCVLTRNLGPHREYINMMDPESCRILIDAVYEPHYAHYKDLFGTTIAGFFSDEPELGNGLIYAKHNTLGTQQDLPWSRPLEEALMERFGAELPKLLPLLWMNDHKGGRDDFKTEAFRVAYMDLVSRLVSASFSQQIGTWCREHGVQYIGHLIEDDDTHTCTGSGLGHEFRGLSGQDMAGIDDIGEQVLPQGEDAPTSTMAGPRSGGFYHYTLGKLGASVAYFDQKKQGRCMCEIFGNYGRRTGVSDMKYLADHFMVRGVNYFVPHAFSPKQYPDPDCPPHFYAQGNNPQYRHFAALCGYMNRVTNLTSGGRPVCRIAILYNAEADWAGGAGTMDRLARELYDHQIDYLFLPLDLAERAPEFDAVLIPPAEYWPKQVLEISNAIFIDRLPVNLICSERCVVVRRDEIIGHLHKMGVQDAILRPADTRIRVLHYVNGQDLYYFVNEGTNVWQGDVHVPVPGDCCLYDAWENTLLPADYDPSKEGTTLRLTVEPRKSAIVLFGRTGFADGGRRSRTGSDIASGSRLDLTQFRRSRCKARNYPQFTGEREITLPDVTTREDRKFSGFVRYETDFEWTRETGTTLVITGPAEGIEVFLNGKSAGLQIVPDYRFDLSGLLREGTNHLTIELATTLARDAASSSLMTRLIGGAKTDDVLTGITGTVFLE